MRFSFTGSVRRAEMFLSGENFRSERTIGGNDRE
jgi:hypothetical protein